MTRKFSVLCAAIALVATVPVHAQSRGQFLVEGGAGLPFYDSGLDLNNKVGFGGRLGYMFSDRIGLEGDVFYYTTQPSSSAYVGPNMTVTPLHGRLTYNAPLGKRVTAILGLGATLNFWGGDSLQAWYNTSEDQDAGPGALVGLRFGGANPFSVRIDWTGDYIVNPFNETGPANDSRFDMGVDLMASFAFGGHSTPRDSDKDGVPDKTPDLCPNTPLGTAVDANGCPFGDADKDGVTDNLDKCPNTPMGATVDAGGCPADQDKDGVLNGIDKCPNTPMGATVDAKGCPADQDGDGVFNGIDQCPNTPVGAAVDAKGCPLDSDGDGVPDHLDRCPGTTAGVAVSPSNGCPLLFEAGQSALILTGVTFATSSAELNPSSLAILDRVANRAQYNPSGSRLEVAGYTDNTGSRAYNIKLSQRRAEAVMAYLISRGVPASSLTAKGYGPDFPIDTNATAAGRANNRRVVLKQIQ